MNPIDVLNKIKFRDWQFVLEERSAGYLLQVQFTAPDNVKGGVPELQKCRKWYVSKHACENEIVRTAWKAVEAAVIHETAEQFTFLGQRVMEPHIDFTALAGYLAQAALTRGRNMDFNDLTTQQLEELNKETEEVMLMQTLLGIEALIEKRKLKVVVDYFGCNYKGAVTEIAEENGVIVLKASDPRMIK